MQRHTFTKRSRIAAPASEVFAWHKRPGAFERYNPPWGYLIELTQLGCDAQQAVKVPNFGDLFPFWGRLSIVGRR